MWTFHRDQIREAHDLTYLFWECTMNCNFFCKHCGSNAGRKIYTNDLKANEIKKVFKDIAQNFNAKKIFIAVTGGEPLLRKDLFEVMSYTNELGFNWGMVTNGFLINEKIVKKMKDAGMNTIDISIDGLGDSHDNFRGVKGAYKHAINAIKLLKDEDFLKTLRISTSVIKNNINNLEELYKTFSKLGIDSWRLINVDPIGRAELDKSILLNTEELTKLFNFIKEKRNTSKIEVTFGCSMFLGLEFEDEVRDYFFYCNTGINIASILHNGDIYVCPNVPRRKELIQGNVLKDNFSDIWKNKFKIFRNKNRTKCKKCSKCEHWDECLGGSFHLWDFNKNEPKRCYVSEL